MSERSQQRGSLKDEVYIIFGGRQKEPASLKKVRRVYKNKPS
ncbi:conserved hypothetical protein [Xenorhabdus nematophila F1]|uniref:Uncharacterized protein n=1 Tax=Xenorhabdus nematophila (strain ATCC 19061 / DSM 3370 / CCUG 14189 / LMG 1036 / NCIMB 9965 / AN6) TaxID=406817 RepID=D3V8Q3_XENNA|nr:hypothetical protein XNC1_1030 [Xenorhabdus nematophila ATCC 19061]CCW31441.1 conserved hypothetical protein [Xenorhabdus nematophila F1]CEE93614.1 hypothetical protein XNA1_4080007 [Xenorhabdus nematophila str. Anatoliense]CEF30879.1 hypothetical protein XNW1_2860011 [Xenorhabdus nematophila str. Websteri]CEK22010.1 hypothetical protein XNC2_1014 [Xenorhabdus nematophila AN6/1]